jgi:hypothetical protein
MNVTSVDSYGTGTAAAPLDWHGIHNNPIEIEYQSQARRNLKLPRRNFVALLIA